MKNFNRFIAYLLSFIMLTGQLSFSKTDVYAATGLNLNVALNKDASLTITWSSYPNAVKYVVFVYDVNSPSKCYANKEYGNNVFKHTTNALPVNNQYKINVWCYDSSGKYLAGEDIHILIPLREHIFIPLDIQAECISSTVYLSWTPVDGAKDYSISFDNDLYNTTDTKITIGNLIPGKNYICFGRTNFPEGSSAFTSKLSVTPLAIPNVTATSTNNSIKLVFKKVPGATSYEIIFDGEIYKINESGKTDNITKTFSNLDPNTKHQYSVIARNARSYSSTPIEYIYTKLPPISNFKAESLDNVITLTWTPVSGADRYDIEINSDNYSTKNSSYKITVPETGKLYKCSVTAKNSNTESQRKEIANITPVATPSNIRATSKYNSANISYDKVPGASGYDILFNGKVYNVNGTNKGFEGYPNTDYKYSVRSKGTNAFSSYSKEESIRTLDSSDALSVPTNIKATATTNSVNVSWSSVNGAKSYDLLFDGQVYNLTGRSKSFYE